MKVRINKPSLYIFENGILLKKKCPKCKLFSSPKGFQKNSHLGNGLAVYCKGCKHKEYLKKQDRVCDSESVKRKQLRRQAFEVIANGEDESFEDALKSAKTKSDLKSIRDEYEVDFKVIGDDIKLLKKQLTKAYNEQNNQDVEDEEIEDIDKKIKTKKEEKMKKHAKKDRTTKEPREKGSKSNNDKSASEFVSKIKKEFGCEVVSSTSNGYMFRNEKSTFLTFRNINKDGEGTLSLSKLDIKSYKSKVPSDLEIVKKPDDILRLKKISLNVYNKVLPLIKLSYKNC